MNIITIYDRLSFPLKIVAVFLEEARIQKSRSYMAFDQIYQNYMDRSDLSYG